MKRGRVNHPATVGKKSLKNGHHRADELKAILDVLSVGVESTFADFRAKIAQFKDMEEQVQLFLLKNQ